MGTGRRDVGLGCAAGRTVLGLLIVCSAAFGAGLEDDALYVPLRELDASRLPVGTVIVTEGQYAGRVADNLALKESSALFLMEDEARSTIEWNQLDAKSWLRLTGKVTFRSSTNTYYISVRRVDSADNLAGRVMKVLGDPSSTVEDLYEIGRTAREWAREHPNERLAELADAAIGKALRMEDLSLGPEDWEGYFALAGKARELMGNASLREYYVREGVRALVSEQGRHKAQTHYDAARKAEEYLPESPLAEILLEKGFAIEKGNLRATGAVDYYALADKAREVFGESDGHRYKSLISKAFRKEHADLSADDYQGRYALARKIRELYADFGDYKTIVTEAVLAEKAALDGNDPIAWNRLADRVLFFLDDRQQAALYFKEAFRLDPGNEESGRALRDLGYVYYGGAWWLPEDFARSEVLDRARELEEMAAAGRVAVGMTRAQVIRAKGQPQSVSIAAGGWGITTQWVYREDGTLLFVSLIADTVIATGRVEGAGEGGGT